MTRKLEEASSWLSQRPREKIALKTLEQVQAISDHPVQKQFLRNGGRGASMQLVRSCAERGHMDAE